MFDPKRILAIGIIAFIGIYVTGCDQKSNQGSKEIKTPELEKLTQGASKGDAKDQLDLAKRYDLGNGVEKNSTQAFNWFLKSAEAGNTEAMTELAKRYRDGNGISKDLDKSKFWWKKAAELGNAEAQYNHSRSFGFMLGSAAFIVGEAAEEAGNAKQYVEWLKKAVEQNYPNAKYDLGMTYLVGATSILTRNQLVQQEQDKGASLVKEAADAGYWEAQWAMGVLYQTGYSKIAADKTLSEKYWGLFSNQSDPEIQRRIGIKYSETDRARYQSGKNKYQGRALSFEETNKIAFEWLQKAAESNDNIAIFNLGKMYREGRGTWKDEDKAIQYFKKAAQLGNYQAQGELAFAYVEGKGVVRDYGEAYKWLLKAAQEDSSYSWSEVHKIRNALGALHEYGWGVEKDVVIAYAWYNIATLGKYDKAKQNLIRVEKTLKPDELREAQTISREWKPGNAMIRVGQPQHGAPGMSEGGQSVKLTSVGSGFYISSNGNILTNMHVIDGCVEIRIPADNLVAKSVVSDQANDLAIVKVEVSNKPVIPFPSSDELKQGEEIFVFGFPLDGYLPSAGNITPGIISALAGPANNSSLVQITAPVQPGNSGGPVLNKKGQVLGVVVGKANALKIAKATGDIPQNVNFAIATSTVKSFLDGNRIEYSKSNSLFTLQKDSSAIADGARKSSIKIECWR